MAKKFTWNGGFTHTIISLFYVIAMFSSINSAKIRSANPRMCSSYSIQTTWDGQPINHNPVSLSIEKSNNSLVINVKAPFFNSPCKPEENVGDFFNLWDYEVVEAFFLNDAGQYIELEFAPFGHYVVLLLDGPRNSVNTGLKLEYTALIDESNGAWSGRALIPEEYFPYKVTKWNAYAIHGKDEQRVYESLYPVCWGRFNHPDFHRLEAFSAIDFKNILPRNYERNSNNGSFWIVKQKDGDRV